jgi:ankyrin repeat protein
MAVYNDDFAMVRLLVQRGARVHTRGGRYLTALAAAKATGNSAIARLLQQHGAKE